MEGYLELIKEQDKEYDELKQKYRQLSNIFNELEQWLKEQEIEYPSYYWDLNNKIQELKEKYKC